MRHLSLGSIIYLIIVFYIAHAHGYLSSLGSLPHFLSAVLAVILWPLLLLGVNLHIAL